MRKKNQKKNKKAKLEDGACATWAGQVHVAT